MKWIIIFGKPIFFKKPPPSRSCETTEPQSKKKRFIKSNQEKKIDILQKEWQLIWQLIFPMARNEAENNKNNLFKFFEKLTVNINFNIASLLFSIKSQIKIFLGF